VANPIDNSSSKALFDRRQLLSGMGAGLGAMALQSLIHGESKRQFGGGVGPHHTPKAKNVIFLFMGGGPSQFELFEPKPKLTAMNGQPVPPSLTEGKRFAFINNDAKLMGNTRKFAKYGECGMDFSELVPHMSGIADDICMIRSMQTDIINHGPAKMFVNSGTQLLGRPSMGAWMNYGLGSESQNLPGFVVLSSGMRGPNGGKNLWSSGFLPSRFQGVALRAGGEPVLDLRNPPGIDSARQGRFFDAVGRLNRLAHQKVQDEEIETRIAAYEMAARMQASAPELTDLKAEPKSVLDLYGVEPGESSFAANCLLARRMVERGVRFIQLYHTDWDHHGTSSLNLGRPLENIARDVDRGSAALVTDLKQRGLLDDTLVIWGGEFGRTPMKQSQVSVGRDHHIDAYSMWLAGGGTKAGYTHGVTDELGYNVLDGGVHVHDLQATILHLMGLDHLRLTYRSQGRNFRLTDVAGEVKYDLLA
jgi:hypothetical protein